MNNLYRNLQYTCNRLDNFFRDVDDTDFSSKPKIFENGRNIKDMAIILRLEVKLTDGQVTKAEEIVNDFKTAIEKDR